MCFVTVSVRSPACTKKDGGEEAMQPILTTILKRTEGRFVRSQQATPRTAGAYEISRQKVDFYRFVNERNA